MEFNRISSIPFSGLSRQEILHGAANRLMYSHFYTVYYIAMLLLGLTSMVTAFVEKCPSLFFIIIESVLCVCMILEIITRGIAMGRSFLKSWWNYFDIVLVLFCSITLILLSRGCSASSNSEELFNTILLVIRNAAQIFRLFATLRKNRRQLDAREMNIDFNSNRGSDFLDVIGDIDGIVDTTDGYRVPGVPRPAGSSEEFRLSIDSLEDVFELGTPGNHQGLENLRRSTSRSSATSVSNIDKLTGRKKGSGAV
ncbi:hypothetical protein FBU59_001490 [Linderina macrospora]|uniref:Uncharacterized protein n=1 Tax=Linderina macrospora TaxID=4868 RepID=A0ACC1JE28_9FUNG|nr:hypothetical protein FBU59_001490 [Linderina macrospora]